MTAYLKALMALFSQAGLPVYLADQVPQGVDFPCAVCECELPVFAGNAVLTLTGWFLSEHSAADCAAFLDRMAELLPESGLRLETGLGPCVLYRRNPFISLTEKDGVTGGQVHLTVRCYFTEGGD